MPAHTLDRCAARLGGLSAVVHDQMAQGLVGIAPIHRARARNISCGGSGAARRRYGPAEHVVRRMNTDATARAGLVGTLRRCRIGAPCFNHTPTTEGAGLDPNTAARSRAAARKP